MKNGNGIIKIVNSARFLKSFKRLSQSIQKKADERDRIFKENPFDSRLATHKLHGRFAGFWAYSVDYRYRVIFVFDDSHTVIYHDIGLHHIYGDK